MPSDTDIHFSVVIPAYNEARRLPGTLDDVLNYLGRQTYRSEVLVVDDGSSDATAQLVRERASGHPILRGISHPDGRNHGKGATVRRGMSEAVGRYRLFMDADNSTTLNHVEAFWPWFEQGYDVVIGSRGVAGAHIVIHQPWHKELGGKIGNRIIRSLVAPGIADTQAGFKMFSQRCIEDILQRLTIERWGFDVELIVAARSRGYRVKELPITWRNNTASTVPAFAYVQVLGEVWKVRKQRAAGYYD